MEAYFPKIAIFFGDSTKTKKRTETKQIYSGHVYCQMYTCVTHSFLTPFNLGQIINSILCRRNTRCVQRRQWAWDISFRDWDFKFIEIRASKNSSASLPLSRSFLSDIVNHTKNIYFAFRKPGSPCCLKIFLREIFTFFRFFFRDLPPQSWVKTKDRAWHYFHKKN